MGLTVFTQFTQCRTGDLNPCVDLFISLRIKRILILS